MKYITAAPFFHVDPLKEAFFTKMQKYFGVIYYAGALKEQKFVKYKNVFRI